MKLRLLALGAFFMCLTSCFDVTETFNIKEDGSGTYELKMDMSRAFGMLAMMKQGAKGDKPAKKLDSVIYYSTMTDTSTTLTPEEKAIFKNAFAKIHLDEDEGEGYVNMSFPFANSKELALIQKTISKPGAGNVMESFGKAFKNGMGEANGMDAIGGDDPMADPKSPKTGGLPTKDFTYSLATNNFSRKVIPSATTDTPKSTEDEMPAAFKEMMKINYATVVNLPRPVKNLQGKGTLSEDKKQVKFSKSIDLDAKTTPADFDFSIDY